MYHKDILRMMISNVITEYELKGIMMLLNSFSGENDSLFSSSEMTERLGIDATAAERILSIDPEPIYRELKKSSIRMITEIDADYPVQLRRILGKKCPPVLFTLGNTELLYGKNVGFTGSRRISQRGENITVRAAHILSQNSITVVSGYARGSDMSAHIAALLSSGTTIFVLAEGIMNFRFKPEIIQLINSQNCLFVSQFSPDARWSGAAALRRNETIIGLSQSVILTEASYHSGTYSTGSRALKFGLPLFVYDYSEPPSTALANRSLIARGGVPIRGKNGVPNLSSVIETTKRLIQSN